MNKHNQMQKQITMASDRNNVRHFIISQKRVSIIESKELQCTTIVHVSEFGGVCLKVLFCNYLRLIRAAFYIIFTNAGKCFIFFT